uniref:Uncharacterized protein n=1 Tax=Cacopsylla melanoneura TaxID=428564 RepID=A0A8D8TLH9_9HEMI
MDSFTMYLAGDPSVSLLVSYATMSMSVGMFCVTSRCPYSFGDVHCGMLHFSAGLVCSCLSTGLIWLIFFGWYFFLGFLNGWVIFFISLTVCGGVALFVFKSSSVNCSFNCLILVG